MSYDSRPDTHEHIAEVRGLMLTAVQDLLRRAHEHDRTKLEPPERETFDRVTPQLRSLKYGSPEYQQALEDMGPALAHHYRAYDHHPEHHENGIHDMDLLQLLEMVCDWIAATKRHTNGDVERSIEINAERFGYGPEIKRALLLTARKLRELSE